jgi:NAD(P)H-dependent FMN reductase
MPVLTVIVGSIHPGRAGLPIAEWFTDRAKAHGGFEVDVADLAEIRLPMMEEPSHPRLRQYTLPHTHEWSARIDRADAVVFVTPEYNYGYPATIKNAIDYLCQEWQDKPAGFVSYGGVAAGTRRGSRRDPLKQAAAPAPQARSGQRPRPAQRHLRP